MSPESTISLHASKIDDTIYIVMNMGYAPLDTIFDELYYKLGRRCSLSCLDHAT